MKTNQNTKIKIRNTPAVEACCQAGIAKQRAQIAKQNAEALAAAKNKNRTWTFSPHSQSTAWRKTALQMIKKLAKRKRSTSESLEIFAMLPERGGAPLPKPLKPTTSLHTDESLQLLPPKTLELPSTLQSFLRLNIIKAVRAVRAVRKDRLLNKYPEQHCYVIAVKDSPICYQRLTADTWDMAGKWNDAPFLTKHGAISQMTTMDNHPLFQRMVIIRQTELRDLQERFAIDVITKCFPYRNHPKP